MRFYAVLVHEARMKGYKCSVVSLQLRHTGAYRHEMIFHCSITLSIHWA